MRALQIAAPRKRWAGPATGSNEAATRSEEANDSGTRRRCSSQPQAAGEIKRKAAREGLDP